MTDEMRRKLARLRDAAPKLNAATDEAARVVQEVEKFLDGLSLGVSARTEIPYSTEAMTDPPDHNGKPGESWSIDQHLAYGRIGDRFRIHSAQLSWKMRDEVAVGDETVLDTTPWSSLPRQEKLESFAQLPDLIDAIVVKVDKLVADAERAGATVRETMAALGEGVAPPRGNGKINWGGEANKAEAEKPAKPPVAGPVNLAIDPDRPRAPGFYRGYTNG